MQCLCALDHTRFEFKQSSVQLQMRAFPVIKQALDKVLNLLRIAKSFYVHFWVHW